ncbi:MAG: glycosyltransferase, partial [Candidatus Omnitrophica bacterium]|nr:glycosyltransferase [Candidatus Omnitrophota bacterium]
MINKHPFVSIIIAHFNGKKMIKDCLDALYGIDYPKNKFEVIVVDNGSSDGSVKFIKNKYKKTTVFVNKINNYCKACNLGIEKSKGEYVVLLNNDVVVGKRWMAALVKVIKNDNSIGAVTSKLFSADTIQNAGLVGLPNFYWDERGAGKDIKEFNSIAEVDAVSGASVLYRRAALEQTGLLDEDFVIFGEDVDLSLRMKKQGWKLVYVPASTAYHKKHGSCDERFAQEAVEKNRLLLVAKHYPHKLPGALITSDYFIVRGEKQKVKSIFILLPEILSKLNKEHQGAIFNEVARDVFDELGRLINYESKKIEEELKDILNDLEETRKNRDHYKSEEDRYKKDIEDLAQRFKLIKDEIQSYQEKDTYLASQLQSFKEEMLVKDNQLIEKDNQLVEKDNQISSLSDQISVLNQQIKQQLDSLAGKESLLAEKQTQLISYKDELNNLYAQLQRRMTEVLMKDTQLAEKDTQLAEKDTQLAEKDTQISSLSDQISVLNQQIKQQLDSLADKESLLTEKQGQLVVYKDELNNLSNQLQQRMEEVLLRSGELLESREEAGALKEELSRLAEELATKIIDIEENKIELTSYKDELNNLSNQLQQRMDEVLIKDGQLIEKDTQISSLSDQISALNQQIKQSLADKESLLTEKQGQLVAYKDELNNLSNQLQQRMEEVLMKDSQVI